MNPTNPRLRRFVALVALVVAFAVPATLAVSPTLITSSAAAEQPAFTSDDFFEETIDAAWTLSGPVDRTSTAGGSVTLTASNGRAEIVRSSGADLRASVGFAAVPTEAGSQAGLVVRSGGGDELFLGIVIGEDARRSIQVVSRTDAGVVSTLADHPVGPLSDPVMALTTRDGSYQFEVAVDGDDVETYGVFTAPFDAAEFGVRVEGGVGVVDYVQDLRDPLLFEDGQAPSSLEQAPIEAIAGSAISIPDDGDDGEEIISVDGGGSIGDVAGYAWWLDGTEVGSDARLTTAVPSGNHELQLEVFDAEGASDVVTVPVIIRSGTGISDDFSEDQLAAQWNAVGSASVVPTAGGALRLGGDDDGRVTAPIDVPVMLAVDYASVAPVDGLETGIVLVDAQGRERRFAITIGGAEDGGVAAAAWSVDGDSSRRLANTEVSATSAPFIRLTRIGSFWRFEVSSDGGALETVAAFSDDFEPVAGGVYAEGGAAIIDYLSDLRTPLLRDDARRLEAEVTTVAANAGPDLIAFGGTDLTDLMQFDGTGSNGEIAAWRWTLDGEPLGVEPAFESTVGVGTYDLLLEVISTTGERDTDEALVTVVDPAQGPFIRSWYGEDVTINRALHPQRWVNIPGEIAAAQAILEVGYRLNGGEFTPLSLGPDGIRLQNQGDFNVELDLEILPNGTHQLDIFVRDLRQTSTLRIDLEVIDEGVPDAAPIEIDFGEVQDFAEYDEVSPVDGLWDLTPDGLTVDPSYTGYDRLVGVGGAELVDYEVTADVIINSYHPPTEASADRPAVGMIVRWTGHNQGNNEIQPRPGFTPDDEGSIPGGAFAFWRVNNSDTGRGRFILHGHDYSIRDSSSGRELVLGQRYRMKVIVETDVDGETNYTFKIWLPDLEEEPDAGLQFTTIPGEGAPRNGSVILLAHHTSLVWENVMITPTGR
ncbi:MAG: hypothetical protein AAGA90_18135 [Actinomycetota bacterium]